MKRSLFAVRVVVASTVMLGIANAPALAQRDSTLQVGARAASGYFLYESGLRGTNFHKPWQAVGISAATGAIGGLIGGLLFPIRAVEACDQASGALRVGVECTTGCLERPPVAGRRVTR
jgi:hypothetical protein